MEITVKKFEELSVCELYDILALRQKVFVAEQNCAYLDADGADKKAYHVFATENGETVGCLRVLGRGEKFSEVSIGRVVSACRKKGIGLALLNEGIKVAREKFEAETIMVGAQVYAAPFYEKAGFVKIKGSEYLEDGIPHVYMERREKL